MSFLTRIFIAFALAAQVFVCENGVAQSRAFECLPNTKLTQAKGEEVLQNTQKTYLTVTTLSAHFAQESYLASLDVSETSEGEMKFEKPGKMKWVYSAPEPQVFLLDDSVVYLYQPKDNQLVVDEFKKVVLTDLPVSFLMGIGSLSKDFKLLSACTNGDGVVLTLHPSHEKGELKELRLLVSPATYLTLGGKVIDESGNVTAVTFKELKTDQKFGADEFKPNFPKGIDVTDRRRADG